MVKLSSDYIIRKILKSTFENEKERNEALKKINHLCLSNKFIHKIDDLSELINISVLYLHENKISKIENFDHCSNLTHLYFQNNDIEKIENISNLRKLKKLYLGYNKITVVESLDNLPNLQELHIECQNLPPGESLYFDPRTTQALSGTLRILDISSNQITSLYDLRELKVIEDLDARNNNISELIPTCHILANWPNLTTLCIEGNPLTKFAKYTDKIIAHTEKLSNLDDKIIKEETRCFLQKFELAKSERRKAKEKHSSHYKFSSDIESLAEHLPPGIRNSISRSILQETVPSSTSLKLSLAQIPAIKELSLEKRVLARPYKKKITTQKSLTKQSETELSK